MVSNLGHGGSSLWILGLTSLNLTGMTNGYCLVYSEEQSTFLHGESKPSSSLAPFSGPLQVLFPLPGRFFTQPVAQCASLLLNKYCL